MIQLTHKEKCHRSRISNLQHISEKPLHRLVLQVREIYRVCVLHYSFHKGGALRSSSKCNFIVYTLNKFPYKYWEKERHKVFFVVPRHGVRTVPITSPGRQQRLLCVPRTTWKSDFKSKDAALQRRLLQSRNGVSLTNVRAPHLKKRFIGGKMPV